MTRRQVARKLGKSIATVRGLEGVHLHPIEDERGVWQFDPDEVERLARDVRSGQVNLWEVLQQDGVSRDAQSVPCAHCDESQKRVQQIETELRRRESAVEQLASQLARERARHALEKQAWETEVAEFVATAVSALADSD